MTLTATFERAEDTGLIKEFLERGYVVFDAEDRPLLDEMRREIVLSICRHLDRTPPPASEDGVFLDTIHDIVPIDKLNAMRLGVYRDLSEKPWFRPSYFKIGRSRLEALVGNELAMQNRINFSVQMPNDKTSLLDIHADVFSGESPYQVVQWVPWVDVHKTKSMFIVPRAKSEEAIGRMKEFGTGGMRALFDYVKNDLVWLDIPYGKVLIFCPNFLHGNVINEEATTRWSCNVRFTGLFTPYVSPDKGLGSFYLPITPRPVTRLGLAYKAPGGFTE